MGRARRDKGSIRGRHLHVIDHDNVNPDGGWFKLEAELLLRGDKATRIIAPTVRELPNKETLEAGSVHNHSSLLAGVGKSIQIEDQRCDVS